MPDNTDDVIDSRDVIERINEIEGEAQGRYMHQQEPEGVSWGEMAEDHSDLLETEDAEELAALKALEVEAENNTSEWTDGATLIRDTYFEQYARDLAEDLGSVPSDGEWPTTYIDWEAAANALMVDYSSVDFDGVTYWVRA